MEQVIRQIGSTPLSISIYSVEQSATKMNRRGVLEIIFCLQGSVRFSYAYEEFTLRAGEFISVDRDAYYLYKGRNNICVSFYLDLTQYEDRYYFIRSNLFVCEGTEETTMPYPTRWHDQLKGIMIAVLKQMLNDPQEAVMQSAADQIVALFVDHFDICMYHAGDRDVPEKILQRFRYINNYLSTHLKDKITLQDLAQRMNLTEGYISQFMRDYSIGFRGILGYLRANESEWYLLNTDDTVIEISEICGFSDPQYYYAAFHRWYHCTPRQFRERYVNETEEKIEYLPPERIETLINDLMRQHYFELFLSGSFGN
ncbi:MAG: helix-turn-helix transcriptional regulator [Anaerovoracaceae bacterium]|jgi:AraC-like DNA-binding protein